MHTLRTTLLACAFLTFGTVTLATPPEGPAEKHHITWTSAKGKAKCCTKKDKAKADQCANKLRKKKASDVRVEPGVCPNKTT